MQVDDATQRRIEGVIRDRFGGKVERIEIETSTSNGDAGEVLLVIRVIMSRETTAGDFSGRFFGLTNRVRSALGSDMNGVFPVIRPVEAHA